MMNEHLVRVVADFLLFLEFTHEPELSLDAANRAEEQLAWRLQRLSTIDRAAFIDAIGRVASSYPAGPQQELVRSLPEVVGIMADRDR